MARMPSRRTLLIVGGLVMVAVVTAAVIVSARNDPPPAVEVQLLALNDFHGNLEPPSGSSGRIAGVEAGGVEFLATQLRLLADEAARPDTVNSFLAGGGDGFSVLTEGVNDVVGGPDLDAFSPTSARTGRQHHRPPTGSRSIEPPVAAHGPR
jgi:2',3'-cyclic-nucleotide 2'-phosphodiesterase (5'-nucleotidase family)